jgi:hypothetical protein
MSEETKDGLQGADPVKEEIKVPATDEKKEGTPEPETKAAKVEPKKEEKKAPANTKAKTETSKAKTPATKDQKAEVSKPETKAATTVADPESGKAAKSEPDFMDHYRKAYPKEQCFHVTSDKQVFLSRDLSLAKRHQKTIDERQEVKTIER